MDAVKAYPNHVIQIIEDAIKDGLIRTERLRNFRKKLRTYKGRELENYIRRLWDEV